MQKIFAASMLQSREDFGDAHLLESNAKPTLPNDETKSMGHHKY